MNLKEQLIAATLPPSEEVEVGGVAVLVVGLSIDEKFELSKLESDEDSTYFLLERMVCDLDRNRLFDDGDPAVRGMDDGALEALVGACQRMLTKSAEAKNSEAAPSLEASSG